MAVSTQTSDGCSPELVSWNTTARCNLRCEHCYLAAGRRAPDELSFEEGCHLIEQLAEAGAQMLILTGGEPLLRRDVDRLVVRAAACGLVVVLGTNGTLLTPARVRQLKAAGLSGAGISLDSLSPEQHDRFRGAPGAWQAALRGIRACVADGLPVLVQMTVLPWNAGEVEAMIALAAAEGATGFSLYFLVCTGRGEQLSDITPTQYEQALATLVAAQARFPQMMVRARCAPQIVRAAVRSDSALVGSAGCLAARRYCRVSAEGEVTPCPYLPLPAGNIRERPFGEIWRTSPLFQLLRRPPGGRCGTCEFRELCGGCRARALALGGDVAGEDPWCDYRPKERPAPEATLPWSAEAEARLRRVPLFIRDRVRLAVERQARASGSTVVTPAELHTTFESLGRRIPFHRPLGPPDGGAVRPGGDTNDEGLEGRGR